MEEGELASAAQLKSLLCEILDAAAPEESLAAARLRAYATLELEPHLSCEAIMTGGGGRRGGRGTGTGGGAGHGAGGPTPVAAARTPALRPPADPRAGSSSLPTSMPSGGTQGSGASPARGSFMWLPAAGIFEDVADHAAAAAAAKRARLG